MDFLKDCARRLDAGESGDKVLKILRKHYTTPRCLNKMTSIVRSLCAPSPEYEKAVSSLLSSLKPPLRAKVKEAVDASDRHGFGDPEVRALLKVLPPRLPENARACRIAREEMMACKRLSTQAALVKNRVKHRVPGVELLRAARSTLDRAEEKTLPQLALALMLLTGRRTCELLNGTSVISACSAHSITFQGQAKKRGKSYRGAGEGYKIPTLAPATKVCTGLRILRTKQGGVVRDNRETSSRYQSELSRTLKRDHPWSLVGHVHALRGIYACMALKLFEWGDPSDAYVTMYLLGHTRLQESLVYTPYDLGPEFSSEPSLGLGIKLPDLLLPSPPHASPRKKSPHTKTKKSPGKHGPNSRRSSKGSSKG